MSGWGDFDDSEEWDAAPAVVQKKKVKKKAEAHSGEWDDAHAPMGQKGAATPAATAAIASTTDTATTTGTATAATTTPKPPAHPFLRR